MLLHVAWRPPARGGMLLEADPTPLLVTNVTEYGNIPQFCILVLEELVVVLWLVDLRDVGDPHVQVCSENYRQRDM